MFEAIISGLGSAYLGYLSKKSKAYKITFCSLITLSILILEVQFFLFFDVKGILPHIGLLAIAFTISYFITVILMFFISLVIKL